MFSLGNRRNTTMKNGLSIRVTFFVSRLFVFDLYLNERL